MQEVKSLNQWLRQYGYHWQDGQEELIKGEMTEAEANATITRLWQEGKIY